MAATKAQQARSRQTLSRILEAAEALLQDRDFEELTMADLAAKAGCAVGTVYRRIPNKDSLLACMYESLRVKSQAVVSGLLETFPQRDLEGRVRGLVDALIEFMVSTRGVNRAVTANLWSRTHSDVDGFRRDTTKAFREAAALLAASDSEIPHERKQEACEFGLLTIFTMAQDRIVFGDRSGIRLQYSEQTLKAQLSILLLAFLRTPQ